MDTNKLLGAVINDRYRVLKLVGKGGSGYVYEGVNLENNQAVALKVLKNVAAEDSESLIRFEKEVAVSAKLTNPHTVRLFEFGRTVEGYLLIAMEFLQGQPLTHYIREEAPLSPRRAVSIVQQTLEALAEAHRVGIVHRDLKPDNIFLLDPGAHGGEGDFVKVLDFGIAKFLHEDSVGDTLTRDGFVFGTPLYISPEQALGWQVSPASDIYSLGVVFFEMLTGDPPFTAETPIGLGMKHIYEPPPLDRLRVGNDSYRGIRHLLALMLEKRPERRPANAGAALALFESLDELTDTPFSVRPLAPEESPAAFRDSPTVRSRPPTEQDASGYLEENGSGTAPALTEAAADALGIEGAGPGGDDGGWRVEPLPEGTPPQGDTIDLTESVEKELTGELSEEATGEVTGEFDGEQTGEHGGAGPGAADSQRRKRKKKKGKKRQQEADGDAGGVAAQPGGAAAREMVPAGPVREERKVTREEPKVTREERPAAPPPLVERRQPPPSPPERRGTGAPVRSPSPPPVRSGRAEDEFSLFGGRSVPAPPVPAARQYFSRDGGPDWREPAPAAAPQAAVGVFAWVVLLLGLVIAAFVVYALVGSSSASGYSVELEQVGISCVVEPPEAEPGGW